LNLGEYVCEFVNVDECGLNVVWMWYIFDSVYPYNLQSILDL